MTIALRKQVCLEVTPYHHCITRCVRQAYLCGYDKQSGRNYNHRRAWIEERLLLLADVFCIEFVGYAVLSTHYHVLQKLMSHKLRKLPMKKSSSDGQRSIARHH